MTETVIKDNLPLLDRKSYVVAEEYEPLTTTAPQAKSTVAYFRKAGYRLLYVEWYAPGVGLVRAISSEGEGTPIKSLTELVSYNVGK